MPRATLMDWRGRQRYAVFDADYGDGSACARLIGAWQADPERPARLHLLALDRTPGPPGHYRLPQADARVTLDLLRAPLSSALTQLDVDFDALRLHGMAADGIDWVRSLLRLCVPGAVLEVEGLDAAQRQALADAGVDFNGSPPVLLSRRPQRLRVMPAPRAIVVGAGLAGAAVCERLCARGWQVTLVERHPQAAQEASGNHAGIFMPTLSRDDNPASRLSRAAFLYALRYWERLGPFIGARCGVLQLARDADHAAVQAEIAARQRLPPDFARWLDAAEAGNVLGAPAPHGAWHFVRGGWARPSSVCAAMLAACGDRLQQRFGTGPVSIVRQGEDWLVVAADGARIASAPTVVLAAGAGATALAPQAMLPLTSVRGQVTYLASPALGPLPMVVCRDAYVIPASDGIVCLGASYGGEPDLALSLHHQHDNLARVADMLGRPGLGQGAPLRGRVGLRCVAPDRLPLVGPLPAAPDGARIERLRDVPRMAGLHGVLGLASRGVVWAPLAAELLAARLEGAPLPLETRLADAVDPGRFRLP